MIKNADLKKRIIEISYELGLSHIASCLTSVDIIKEIYDIKKPDEKFVLSAGHAHLAHLVVKEDYNKKNGIINLLDNVQVSTENLINIYGIHCDRQAGCDCSTGSLGQGVTISLGMALSNRNKDVYVLLSDGEMNEGSVYEALEIAHEQNLKNLKVYINCNNLGAYKSLDREHIIDRCRAFTNVNITFRETNVNDLPFLVGLIGHYKIMEKKDYEYAINKLG